MKGKKGMQKTRIQMMAATVLLVKSVGVTTATYSKGVLAKTKKIGP